MYEIFVSVIKRGGFKLSDMLERVAVYCADGKITVEEMHALEQLAREHAEAKSEINVIDMLLDHETRIRALEANPDAGTETVVPPFAAGKTYYKGNRVTFDGSVYECIAPDGAVCVWSPANYAAYWQIVK